MGSAFDFISSLLDEIALEGLDGITLPMLWQRISDRPNFPIGVDDDSKSFFWDNIAKHKDVEIYELPVTRKFEPIYNRYDHIDPELEVVLEPLEKVPDPYYPIVPVKDGEVRGSCAAYTTRKCITSDIRCGNDVLLMSLSQVVEKWGDRLVLVASPKVRLLSLIGTEINPLIEFSLEGYCLLERIGRSRYHGEVTQGEGGLLALKAPFCKQLHYYRKKLTLKGLITKQTHYMKSKKGPTANGSLFHLTRFYVLHKTKMASLMKRLCDILKDKPQNRESCMALREEMDIKDRTFKKLFYRPFQKWVKFETVTCKEFYPNASHKDWFTIGGNEKVVKIVQLMRHCDEEGDEEEEATDENRALPLNVYFDSSRICPKIPLVFQIYDHIKDAGPEGISASDLGRIMTLPRLDIRTLLRLLSRRGHVITVLQDRGRQKVTKYIAKLFESQNEAYSTLEEQKKMSSIEAKMAEERSMDINQGTKRTAPDENGMDVPASKRVRFEEEVLENSVNETAKNEIVKIKTEGESNYQKIVSQVLEIRNKSQPQGAFNGKDPEVSLLETPSVTVPYANSTQLTYRKLKRSNMILDFLKSERFSTLSDLQKYVLEKEKEEGYSFKLDKKSTARLVYGLYNSKKIKIFKAILKLDDEQNAIEFICDNSLEPSDPLIQVAIEQAKFKLFGVSKEIRKIQTSSKREYTSKQANNSSPTARTAASKEKSVKRGHSVKHQESKEQQSMTKYPIAAPKFIRTKLLHQFLYYLVYQHKGEPGVSNEQRIYHDSMTWKRYVPPLPSYGKEGWCFLADIYASMPLSLFIKIVNFRQDAPGLLNYLDDEEKTHYLIKFLPQNLRNSLLNKRKYLFSTNDIIHLLCYIGLVSIGPQVGKLKDQVFLYIHRNASIRDTTVSPAGYIHVSKAIEYELKSYSFQCEDDVENFWLDLESICFHTPLGKFSAAVGKTIAITEASSKPELLGTTKNKGFEEIEDIGTIPGDALGAGGFDSILFLHTRRNWQPSNVLKQHDVKKGATDLTPVLRPMQQMLKSAETVKPESRSRLQRLTKNPMLLQKENELKKPRSCTVKTIQKAPALTPVHRRKRIKLRTVKMRASKKRSPYYDEKDRIAMEKLDKSRCDWSSQEDSFLLLCKVASSFLDPIHNKNLVVPYTIVRDLLYEHVPGVSANKSSRACQRRVRYMMLNSTTTNNVKVFLGEALQDAELVREFSRPKPPKSNEEVWRNMFTTVLNKLREKFSRPASDRCKNIILPQTIEEFNNRFELIPERDVLNQKQLYNRPENVQDINKFLLISLILSAMALVNDGTQWSKLLHRLYQSYPEREVQAAVTRLRKERIIAVKKKSHKTDIQRSLRSTCPYKFSITYSNAMLTKFPAKIFKESKVLLDNLLSLSTDTNVELKGDVPAGYAAAVLSLVTMQHLSVHTQIPNQIILFDSSLSKEARTNIVERMIHTLSEKESKELSELLNSENISPLPDYDKEEHPLEHSSLVHDSEMTDTDQMLNTDLSMIQGSQSNEGQRSSNASRFALYLLRQEMSQPPVERVQHSQDYIVLNSCRVFCRLKSSDNFPVLHVNPAEVIETTPDWQKTIESEYISKEGMILTDQRISEITNTLKSFIPPEALHTKQNYPDLIETMYEQYSPQTLHDARCIFQYIYDAGTHGISEKETWQEFQKLSGELSVFEHLSRLREAFLIVRAGIVKFTYVCICFADCWILTSYRLSEGIAKDKKQHSPKSKRSNSKQNTQCSKTTISDAQDSCLSCLHEDEQSEETSILSGQNEPTKSGVVKRHINLGEKVYFIPRTWRKPDGTLNVTVFFDLLSTVLGYIICTPGTSTLQICEHFLLVLPPVQTLELIEILEKACCVYKYYCKKMKKSSLFSSPGRFYITENPGPEDSEHIEPFPDAVCKVARLRDTII